MTTYTKATAMAGFLLLASSAFAQEIATVRVEGTVNPATSTAITDPNFPGVIGGSPVVVEFTVFADSDPTFPGAYPAPFGTEVALTLGTETVTYTMGTLFDTEFVLSGTVNGAATSASGDMLLDDGTYILFGHDIGSFLPSIFLRDLGTFTLPRSTTPSSTNGFGVTLPGMNGAVSCAPNSVTIDVAAPLGDDVCAGVGNVNSTGQVASLTASGSNRIPTLDVTFQVRQAPPQQFGILIASQSTVASAIPIGEGLLCLGSPQYRFMAPDQIFQTDAAGAADVSVDLTQIGGNGVTFSVQANEKWFFQVWTRDQNAAGQTSNLTTARSVTFR